MYIFGVLNRFKSLSIIVIFVFPALEVFNFKIPLGLSSLYAQEKMRIAIMDFQAKDVPENEASKISELIRNDLVNTGKFIVIERAQMGEVLKHVGRFCPEWVAASRRNGQQVYTGISGRLRPDFAILPPRVRYGKTTQTTWPLDERICRLYLEKNFFNNKFFIILLDITSYVMYI